MSYFGAAVGPALPRPRVQAAPPAILPAVCTLCQGPLVAVDGLLHCEGRCRTRWAADGAGRWVGVGSLPYGVCACCRPRRALVQAACGAVCPAGGVEYLLLAEGSAPRREAAPLGICVCCLPPQPLVQVAHALVCRAKPDQHYARRGEAVVWLGAQAAGVDVAAAVAAIDDALSRNQAAVTLHGLFTVG